MTTKRPAKPPTKADKDREAELERISKLPHPTDKEVAEYLKREKGTNG